MTNRPTYTANVERDGRWWFIQVAEVRGAHTQARRLSQVEPMAREAIALLLEVDEDSFDVTVRLTMPDRVSGALDRARELRSQATQAQSEASTLIRDVAHQLRGDGLTIAEVGQVLGVSFQRASQLLAEPHPAQRAS